MREITIEKLKVLQFENLSAFHSIFHAVTTRIGGLSTDIFSGLNLSYSVKDEENIVSQNRNLLAKITSVSNDRLIFPVQTHSVNIKIITENNFNQPIYDTDALITNQKNIALCVLSADCVPILLFDKKEKVVASVHAGWKGTVNGILHEVLSKMQHEFNTQPENIIAGIGPSICTEHYEVGSDVIEQFKIKFERSDLIISNYHGEKAHINLWEANKIWLKDFGIPESNIEVAGICTYKNPELFYSARYSKNNTGRFGAVIKLI